ncbi:hypothetical protein [Evansella tamaricis]|uniref:Molecular chaperone DnaK n=1 Tax=Evansella tamaricis TaxID=2069301 RepID=A0ABS6JH67_9BACI|nr:hypothetical protein [Evansella tamaricis]MBU9712740.1 hypothetical protein [Evansella tamaricis]
MEKTKVIDRINVHTSELDEIIGLYFDNLLEEVVEEVNKDGAVLFKHFHKLIEDRWVFMENNVFYDNETVSVFPDLESYKCFKASENNRFIQNIPGSYLKFSGYSGDFMTIKELKTVFNRSINFPHKSGEHHVKYNGNNKTYRIAYKKGKNTLGGFDIDDNTYRDEPGVVIPIFRLLGKPAPATKLDSNQVIHQWLKHHLLPKGIKQKYKDVFKIFCTLRELDYLNQDLTVDMELLREDIEEQDFSGTLCGRSFDRSILLRQLQENTSDLIMDSEVFYDKLLNCERYRADIETYDEKMLTDPNRGHWDLWEEKDSRETVTIPLTNAIISRNPAADIRQDGVIGIDFGTKSTVVVYQENSEHTLPMRVGLGHFSKKVEPKHYENPTVMEFIDLDSFLNQYQLKPGRPNTSWEDITVSHTAFNSLMQSSSEHYYSVISDIKQWAGDKRRQIRLKDKTGKDMILPSFLEIEDGGFNPIELYAYYIGLYINNQHHGIYMDYILSFPVTYEKDVRKKIIESFEKGIKKSLPTSLLEDEEIMKNFRVINGASEPAAYAICALQEYGFEPVDEDSVFYGVFDFGGGTTDFDFGIWREANEKERRYDFVIEHFAAGGDKFLGGENLLELLAFEVFKANQDKLREGMITFTLPPECTRFAGSETLLSESQEAKLNMKQLMEKLRPLWEKHENYEKEFEKDLLKVNLFDKAGQAKPNFELSITQEGLEDIIEQRIEKGIRNFFDSLRRSFEKTATRKIEKVNIFLAGNASKSPIVKQLFDKYMEEETFGAYQIEKIDKELFEIFPPLGTDEAYEKLEEMGVPFNRNKITKPTGKTGVAFGLIQSRKGGRIRVIDHNIVQDEVKFKFFVGMSRRGKFKVILDPENGYSKWHLFIDASEEDFELYYTTLPEASRNQLEIQQTQRKKCKIDYLDEDAYIFIRPLSPTMMEYVVATEDGIKNESYLSEINQIELH